MEATAPLFTRLYNWLTGEPNIRQKNIQILRIPPDGSRPEIIQVNTIDAASEGNVDCWMVHIPDFRPYWGTREGFRWRDAVQMEVRAHQAQPELNGLYIGWKSFALDLIPISEKTGFCGDAFVAKLPLWEHDEHGAVYEDFPVAFVDSELWGPMVERMHDR